MTRAQRTNPFFLLALAAAFIAFAARWFLASASQFSRYDDEGFVMLMLRSYLAGEVIYSGFYAQYGPFVYQALAVVHRVLGLVPSNDAVRISSLLVYAGTFAVWAGIAVHLLRQPAVVILFVLGLGQHLMTATVEPGHPQDLGALLVSLCAAAALAHHTAASQSVRRGAAICGGVVLGALLLTKLNVGVFVAAALLFQAPLERCGWRAWRWGVLLLPLLLMQQRLDDEWVRNFCLVDGVGLLLFLAATLDTPATNERSVLPWLAGLLAAMTLILGVEVGHGATPHALADGIVFQHLDFPAQATQQGFFPPEVLWAAAISVGVFLLLWLTRRQVWSAAVANACRLIVAAAGLAYAIGFGVDYLLAFGLAFVWLLLAPRRAPREWITFLGALALLLPLQAYPVAGTQVYLGAIPLMLLCALTFDDIVAEAGSAVIRAALALLAVVGLLYQFGALRTLADRYDALTPLALPGASSVRLPAAEVETYQRLTQRMRHFDAFVSQPGLLSLYFWTQRAAPTNWHAGAWMRLITAPRQEEIVVALRRANRPGAAVSPQGAAFWTEWRQDLSSPLAAYLEHACTTTETIGEWQVRACARVTPEQRE